jgi:hypothetical protein
VTELGEQAIGAAVERVRRDASELPSGLDRRRRAHPALDRCVLRRRCLRRLGRGLEETPLAIGLYPPELLEPLPHRRLRDPEPSSDLAVAEPLGLHAEDGTLADADELALRSRFRGSARGPTEGLHPVAIVPALVPAERARAAPERACHVVLVGVAALDERDHRVGLGGSVLRGVVLDHQAIHQDGPMPAARAHHHPVVDDDRALLVAARLE